MSQHKVKERELDKQLNCFLQAALAPSTKAAYSRCQQQFIHFCRRMNYVALPATLLTIACYVTFLASSLLQQTISSHLAALRLMHSMSNHSIQMLDDPLVHYTLRGVMKTRSSPPVQMKPMTPILLRCLCRLLDFKTIGDCLFWAATLIMFYSLLRRSNVLATTSSFVDCKLLRRSNVTFGRHYMILSVCANKTRSTSKPQHAIRISARPGHLMCPVGALCVALATTPESACDRPLLSWTNGLPYTSGEFVTRLRYLLKTVSEPPLAYGCHSFRRGGATHAFRIGVPTELIRSLGD